MDKTRGQRKTRVGLVVSDKMDKTVVVEVNRMVKHSLYKRYVRRTARFKAHDPENACRVGDRVRISSTRPLSKEKRWRVVDIIEKAR
ncbi:MAG TPA: 30S ribosomal protein S17 [Firmicutes bacterium]|nr:30S ribosomal protein S17 [Bacillota bacterium]